MTIIQWATIGILLAMLIAYASEWFRIEAVAITGLATAYLIGVVPTQAVFMGFSSPAVITVVEVLLLVSSLSQTRIMDEISRKIISKAKSETGVLIILCTTAASVSVFMNNIGALALFFPVALSTCEKLNIPPHRILMPLSFSTLLGGMCSLTGTPANLIVNQWKISETGSGFGYFELAVIGGPVAIAGLIWIVIAAPLIFRNRSLTAQTSGTSDIEIGPGEFLAEMTVPTRSPLIGLHLPDAEILSNLHIHGVIRRDAHVFARRGDISITSQDKILLEGPLTRMEALRENGSLATDVNISAGEERVEAVVMPDSLLIGSRVGDILAFAENSIKVTALASRRHRIEGGFNDLQIGLGDVLVLAGEENALHQTIADCGLLPLLRKPIRRTKTRAAPSVLIFAAGILLSAFGVVSTEIAFGAVVLFLIMTRNLNLRTALQEMNWPIVILLACMIPLGQAVQDSGTARVIANILASHIALSEPLTVVAMVLGMAVMITPFIDNVSTAAILSPIAAGIATRTGVPIEPLLMAVAIGASLDFLTPFGHHNNTVVMGAAGYRFRDFSRFGGPLTLLCVGAALFSFAIFI